MDVSKIFNQFAGKEVAVTEVPYKFTFKSGTSVEGVTVRADDNEPTIAALSEAAAKAGYSLRLWLPGTAGTCDWDDTRLNAHVEKEADGKYRIQPNFNLG